MEKNIFYITDRGSTAPSLLTRLTSTIRRSKKKVDDLNATAGQPILIRVTDTRETIHNISMKMRMQAGMLSLKLFEECIPQGSPGHE